MPGAHRHWSAQAFVNPKAPFIYTHRCDGPVPACNLTHEGIGTQRHKYVVSAAHRPTICHAVSHSAQAVSAAQMSVCSVLVCLISSETALECASNFLTSSSIILRYNDARAECLCLRVQCLAAGFSICRDGEIVSSSYR